MISPRPPHRIRRVPTIVMWVAIAASTALLAVLLRRGWGDRAWSIAGGLLLLSCIGVCVWAAVTSDRSARLVDREIARLAETRRHSHPTPPHP